MPILGETTFMKTTVNGNTVYQYMPWGGNVPYGYTMISFDDYIAGLASKIREAQNFMATWKRTQPGNLSYYNSAGQQYSGPTYDQNSINEFQRQIDEARSKTGMFTPGYIDPSLAKFLPNAPTPSEQFYTPTFFATLAPSEQQRLKNMFPGTYANYALGKLPAGYKEVQIGGGFALMPISPPVSAAPPVQTPTTVVPPKTTTTPTQQTTTLPKPPPIPAQTSLGTAGLIVDLVDLKLKANAALNDFINQQRTNTEVNLRLSTTYKDEAGIYQYGKAQQVITGSYANGQPKYKTVITKFAILDIYDKKNGKRGSKVGTTLIGTIDSLALKPTTDQLNEIETGIV